MSRSSAKARHELRVFGKMRQDTQLDLGIIGHQQRPAGEARNERLADLLAVLGADRDVLEVRIARAEPARRRDDLVERGMNTAVVVDERGKRVEIGILELLKLAVLHDQTRQRMPGGELFEDFGIGAGLALRGLLRRRKLQLLEQDLPQLRAGGDVEGVPGRAVDLGFDGVEAVAELPRKLLEPVRVDPDADALHLGQDADEGPLQVGVEVPQTLGADLGPEDRIEPPGGVGVLSRVFARRGPPRPRPCATGSCLCRSGP